MPKTINPTAAWHDTLNVPRPGEGVKAAGVDLPFSDLLANDKYLQGRVDALEAALAKLASSTPTTGGETTPGTPGAGGATETPANPVTASFTAMPGSTGGLVSFSATASSTAGNITGYDWTFGDGTTASGQSVNHTYSGTGPYTATLTVHDSAGNTKQSSQAVTAPASTPTPTPTPTPIPTPISSAGTVTADYSASTDALRVTYTANASTTSVFNGSPATLSYRWDFGDGQFQEGSYVTHAYAAAGTYQVSLTVTDSLGQSKTASHAITVTPAALPVNFQYNYSQTTGLVVNAPVTFVPQVTSTDPALSYLWEFGDGATSTAASPTHTYTTSGPFAVKLTVTDSKGGQGVQTASLNVSALPVDLHGVSVSIGGDTSGPWYEGYQYNFTASATTVNSGATITGYQWSVVNPDTGQNLTGNLLTYNASRGLQTISVTATDSKGATGTAQFRFTAEAADLS